MGWTKRSYDAVHEWGNKAKREEIKKVLLADGLKEEVERLENAENMGVWYKITQEAVAAVGPGVVEDFQAWGACPAHIMPDHLHFPVRSAVLVVQAEGYPVVALGRISVPGLRAPDKTAPRLFLLDPFFDKRKSTYLTL